MMEEQPVMSALGFRVLTLEKELENVKRQLNLYVPLRENDLQLRVIHETVDRIEEQLADVRSKITLQEQEMLDKEATMQHNQANLQIKILWGTVSTIVGLMTSVMVGYITHLFH